MSPLPWNTEWREKVLGNKDLFFTPHFSIKGQLFPWERIYLISEIERRKGNELPTFMSTSTWHKLFLLPLRKWSRESSVPIGIVCG